MRALKIQPLRRFPAHSTALLTAVIVVCVVSSELTQLVTESLCPWTSISPFPPPRLLETLILFSSLWIWLFYIPHTSEIMQHLSFCVWLISLKVHPCGRLWQDVLCLQGWMLFHDMSIHHAFFVCSHADSHLASPSQLLGIMLGMETQTPILNPDFSVFGSIPRRRIPCLWFKYDWSPWTDVVLWSYT